MSNISITVAEKVQKQVMNALIGLCDQELAKLKQSVSTGYPPASSPGNPPHMRTGELLRGIKMQVSANEVLIESTAEHSDWLEYGTSRIEPRPYMRPSMQRLQLALNNQLGVKIQMQGGNK